jgi:[ribosomal protein S5]-alanine N-acetyltransferase
MKKKIRVYLRALEVEDHLKIHKWRTDEEIKQNFSGIPLYSSSLNEKNWVESKIFDKHSVSCAICINETNEFIGCIFLNDIDYHNRTGHIPVLIGEKQYWGQGYATDARIIMLKYAFMDRGLERIWAKVIEGNDGAIRMLEKAGFRKEGLLRNSCFRNGQFVNEIFMGVLKSEFCEILKEYEL